MHDRNLQRSFPPELHESLAELRKLARSVKSLDEWRQVGRKATPEEIALAETFREPNSCIAYSSRTGLPCALYRMKGLTVCDKHGGLAPSSKAAAKRRLDEQADRFAARLIELAEQNDHLPTAVNATKEGLDRSLGPLRSGSHEAKQGVQINIGIFASATDVVEGVSSSAEVIDAEITRENEDSEDN
jgi:hypothetical protein